MFDELWQDVLALLMIAALVILLYARSKGLKVLTVLKMVNEQIKGMGGKK